MSRATIHFSVHNHPIPDGKYREFVEETRRLIIEGVDCMLDAKISLISLSANKTFLASYLLDDYNDGIMELLKDEQLEHI
jgi:hypothetical protein